MFVVVRAKTGVGDVMMVAWRTGTEKRFNHQQQAEVYNETRQNIEIALHNITQVPLDTDLSGKDVEKFEDLIT